MPKFRLSRRRPELSGKPVRFYGYSDHALRCRICGGELDTWPAFRPRKCATNGCRRS